MTNVILHARIAQIKEVINVLSVMEICISKMKNTVLLIVIQMNLKTLRTINVKCVMLFAKLVKEMQNLAKVVKVQLICQEKIVSVIVQMVHLKIKILIPVKNVILNVKLAKDLQNLNVFLAQVEHF